MIGTGIRFVILFPASDERSPPLPSAASQINNIFATSRESSVVPPCRIDTITVLPRAESRGSSSATRFRITEEIPPLRSARNVPCLALAKLSVSSVTYKYRRWRAGENGSADLFARSNLLPAFSALFTSISICCRTNNFHHRGSVLKKYRKKRPISDAVLYIALRKKMMDCVDPFEI